jgi:hypothetical protein
VPGSEDVRAEGQGKEPGRLRAHGWLRAGSVAGPRRNPSLSARRGPARLTCPRERYHTVCISVTMACRRSESETASHGRYRLRCQRTGPEGDEGCEGPRRPDLHYGNIV